MGDQLQDDIKRVLSGDKSAFRRLVESYQQYAFSVAFRILCDEEEARDSVQEAFIKIWKNLHAYRASMPFRTWLSSIVTHTAIDRLRVISRQNQVSIHQVSDHLYGMNTDSFLERLENAEASRLIRAISDLLPEKQRLIFILRDIQGMSSSEVQLVLDLPESAVKSNLYYARNTVRKQLQQILTYERK